MTMTPSRPITVVSTVSSERIRLLLVFITSPGPSMTLPAESCSWASHTAFQLPMSDQRKLTGNTAASAVRFHHCVVDRFPGRLCELGFGEAVEIEIGGEVVDGVF